MHHSSTQATPPAAFANTRWSLVLSARVSAEPRARQALEDLCRIYWPPLYAFIRRQGFAPHEAEDLTQGFFARLLAHDQFASADRSRGRFRSYLLGALKHFLANEWDRANTLKRGGNIPHLPLDPAAVEPQLGVDPGHGESPERIYERHWALALLQRVLQRLEVEQTNQGNGAQFESLKVTLTSAKGAQSYAELATHLHMTEGAVKVAVHRLRKRYRELLYDEIRETVEDESEVEGELRHLLASL